MKIIRLFESSLLAQECTDNHEKSLNAHAKATQSSARRPSPCVEIGGKKLTNGSSETIGKSLPEKGFVESVDKKSGETLFVDEEKEVIRSKTIRFFQIS